MSKKDGVRAVSQEFFIAQPDYYWKGFKSLGLVQWYNLCESAINSLAVGYMNGIVTEDTHLLLLLNLLKNLGYMLDSEVLSCWPTCLLKWHWITYWHGWAWTLIRCEVQWSRRPSKRQHVGLGGMLFGVGWASGGTLGDIHGWMLLVVANNRKLSLDWLKQ